VRQYTLFCRERAGTTDFRLTKNVPLEMWRNSSVGMVENQQVAKLSRWGAKVWVPLISVSQKR